MKRRIKIYDDVELLEVSPVGIASYPDAVNRSLIKSIMSKMTEEENQTQTQEEKPEESESSEEEKKPEEESKPEETSENEEKSKVVQMTKDNVQDLISGIVKELQADRKGLVEKQEKVDVSKEVDEMSPGEAIQKMGFFNKDVRAQSWY